LFKHSENSSICGLQWFCFIVGEQKHRLSAPRLICETGFRGEYEKNDDSKIQILLENRKNSLNSAPFTDIQQHLERFADEIASKSHWAGSAMLYFPYDIGEMMKIEDEHSP